MTDPIGERVRRLRQQKGMGLRELARVAHVPVSTLSAVETGVRKGSCLTIETGRKLARALGVTLDHLAFMYEESTPSPRQRARQSNGLGTRA